MSRAWIIVLSGILIAAGAFVLTYSASMRKERAEAVQPMPELAWLKQEFHLDDAEFQRICSLHDQYVTACAERCRKIDAKNAELRRLLSETNTVTPEIERTLREAAQMRAECQKEMLQHCFEVSRRMPASQGRRYLEFVQRQTILADSHSQMVSPPPSHHHAEP